MSLPPRCPAGSNHLNGWSILTDAPAIPSACRMHLRSLATLWLPQNSSLAPRKYSNNWSIASPKAILSNGSSMTFCGAWDCPHQRKNLRSLSRYKRKFRNRKPQSSGRTSLRRLKNAWRGPRWWKIHWMKTHRNSLRSHSPTSIFLRATA